MGAGLCFHGRCRSRHIASAVVRSGHVDVSFAGDPSVFVRTMICMLYLMLLVIVSVISFFSHLVSRVSDSAWGSEAPLTVEAALDYLSGEFSEEELTEDSSLVFLAERSFDALPLPAGSQMLISLSGYRADGSSDEISSIRLTVTASTSCSGEVYPLAAYVAEAPTMSELKLFLEVFNKSLTLSAPASLVGYMTQALGSSYTVRPWEYIPALFTGDPRSHVGGIYYLPGSRPSAPWRRVVVRDVRRAGRGLSVLVASSDEEFWVPASCLFFRV